jgi:hypothetical protein
VWSARKTTLRLSAKEVTMQYKTIALELLEQRPELHEQLRRQRKLLVAMEFYASELKALHEAWKKQLLERRPDSDESQIATEALELALQELQGCLESASPPDETDPLFLEEAMAFLRKRTPPA